MALSLQEELGDIEGVVVRWYPMCVTTFAKVSRLVQWLTFIRTPAGRTQCVDRDGIPTRRVGVAARVSNVCLFLLCWSCVDFRVDFQSQFHITCNPHQHHRSASWVCGPVAKYNATVGQDCNVAGTEASKQAFELVADGVSLAKGHPVAMLDSLSDKQLLKQCPLYRHVMDGNLKKGDSVLMQSVDRAARSPRMLTALVGFLIETGVQLFFVTVTHDLEAAFLGLDNGFQQGTNLWLQMPDVCKVIDTILHSLLHPTKQKELCVRCWHTLPR